MKTGNALLRMLEGLVTIKTLLPYTGDWVPEEHVDRLRQYEAFRALAENRLARHFRDREVGKRLREYGDYSLIVQTARDAVLGDSVGIEVPGATDPANTGAVARQGLLDAWGERERWASKVHRGEHDAAEVGDCVYELRTDGDRLRLRSHDPESFFPVWDNSEGDFGEAYLAWEDVNNGQYLPGGFGGSLRDLRARDGEVVLYRRHYRQIGAGEASSEGYDLRGREQVCVVTAGWYQLQEGARDAVGWARFGLLGYELDRDGAPVLDVDTGFDGVPLYYVPNVESNRQPWGLPEGYSVLQVLLDASGDQTDLRDNTQLNAFPVLFDEHQPVSGVASVPRPGTVAVNATEKYRPGTIYNGRKIGVVDLSNANKVLMDHEHWLIAKALRNSRTSPILAGLMGEGQFPSGYAMVIAMLPTLMKTLPKRQTRRDKLGMMLKHVLRWHRDWGSAEGFFGTPTWPASMFDSLSAWPTFGSMVPVNRKEVSEIVRDLIQAGAISEEVAVAILQGAGFPIYDATAEVERLRAVTPGLPGSGMGSGGLPPIPGITDPA